MGKSKTLLFFVCLFLLSQTVSGQSKHFDTVKIAEGVYTVIRKDPPGFAVESNSVFIIGDKDVIVVDAQSNIAKTKEVLAALKKLTKNPVKYVVNTHWHDDHIIGNQVYRDAFMDVEFIAHAKTRAYLPTTGMANREKFHQGIPSFLDQLRNLVKTNKNFRGEPLNEEERISLLSDIFLGEGYMTVPKGFEPILPTITIDEKLTLYQDKHKIEIKYLGRGHTSGDIVIYLPQNNIVIAGDLIVYPVPFIGGDQSHVGDWGATLEKLLELKPTIIIPGHGPIMRDDSYTKLVTRLMNSVKEQTSIAVARGETLEQARKSVNLDEYRKLFAGESKVKNTLFSNYVTGPAVMSAFGDAVIKK